MIRSTTRSGATLTEVLVAIFVMAIGLLALLTLFPLGALSMAQAIKDGRTAQSAKNAFAIAEAYNSGVGTGGSGVHNDPFVTNNGTFLGPGGIYQGVAGTTPANASTYFLNPYPGIPQIPLIPYLAPDLLASAWDGPSYPIYVDPWSWNVLKSSPLSWPNQNTTPPFNVPPNVPYWVVGNLPLPTTGGLSGIPRLPMSGTLNNQWLDRWCTLSDDITFQENGIPSTNTGTVQRENRYTWAWLLRRPKANDPTVVDVTVVVYSGRSLTSLGETAFTSGVNPNTLNITTGVWFDPSSKFVDIAWPVGSPRPSVRTGSWILDATMEYYVPGPPPVNVPDPHGFFYRVVGVTDLSSNSIRLELQTYPKKRSFYNTTDLGAYGVLIVMENVVEVFEKGPGWQP
jgi:hypothetical protein